MRIGEADTAGRESARDGDSWLAGIGMLSIVAPVLCVVSTGQGSSVHPGDDMLLFYPVDLKRSACLEESIIENHSND